MVQKRSPYVVKIAKVATGTLFAAMSLTGVMMAPLVTTTPSTLPPQISPQISPQDRINAVHTEMAAAVAQGEVSREQADKFVAQLERSISNS